MTAHEVINRHVIVRISNRNHQINVSLNPVTAKCLHLTRVTATALVSRGEGNGNILLDVGVELEWREERGKTYH